MRIRLQTSGISWQGTLSHAVIGTVVRAAQLSVYLYVHSEERTRGTLVVVAGADGCVQDVVSQSEAALESALTEQEVAEIEQDCLEDWSEHELLVRSNTQMASRSGQTSQRPGALTR